MVIVVFNATPLTLHALVSRKTKQRATKMMMIMMMTGVNYFGTLHQVEDVETPVLVDDVNRIIRDLNETMG